LKGTDAKPGLQMVEREFGLIELHSPSVDQVRDAGNRILEAAGLSIEQRLRARVVSAQTITLVHPYQAQQINKMRKGSLLLPGQTLVVIEVEPAAYVVQAANEAEKASNVNLVHFNPFGRFGRLWMAGTESDAAAAREAAIAAFEGR
jgi:hypothetical protein